jgi:hypothetical protein
MTTDQSLLDALTDRLNDCPTAADRAHLVYALVRALHDRTSYGNGWDEGAERRSLSLVCDAAHDHWTRMTEIEGTR